ncbi:unnamed protein product [Gongylonema pulchrum]|uniref:PCI domain-containing protein n=1 Tax=Gongylonema pulchrum TaxID=637853 RepID=A0A183DRL8_9BILA|nr:unnamed protein product [Gongylonema pulchrum]
MEVDESPKKEEEKKKGAGGDAKEGEKEDAQKAKSPDAVVLENLRAWCSQLEKGELHVLPRMIQLLHKTRKQVNASVLTSLINSHLASLPLIKEQLLQSLPSANSVQPCVEMLISRIDYHEKRSLDSIAAKAYFYLCLIYETKNKLDQLRAYLNGRLRTATLRRQYDSQAVLIVCLLRAYLLGRHYEAAAMLVSKVTFPEGASNNDLARFLYYQGRIKAMQLNYTAAAGYFMQAIRKAPQDAAIGFKQNVQKWIVVISLLQGEIPERSVFRVPIHRKTLAPYLELTQAVRLGDLLLFNKVLNKHAKHVFEPDETLTLIAIKDGGIEAAVSFDSQHSSERYMQSKETEDVYRTTEPQTHFDTRIRCVSSQIIFALSTYCLELHNQAVKALRYPAKSGKGLVESIEEQREREMQVRILFRLFRLSKTAVSKRQFRSIRSTHRKDTCNRRRLKMFIAQRNLKRILILVLGAFDTRIRYCLELHNQAVKALRYPAKSGKGLVESIEEQREREMQN